jgi:hypothetical protein
MSVFKKKVYDGNAHCEILQERKHRLPHPMAADIFKDLIYSLERTKECRDALALKGKCLFSPLLSRPPLNSLKCEITEQLPRAQYPLCYVGKCVKAVVPIPIGPHSRKILLYATLYLITLLNRNIHCH